MIRMNCRFNICVAQGTSEHCGYDSCKNFRSRHRGLIALRARFSRDISIMAGLPLYWKEWNIVLNAFKNSYLQYNSLSYIEIFNCICSKLTGNASLKMYSWILYYVAQRQKSHNHEAFQFLALFELMKTHCKFNVTFLEMLPCWLTKCLVYHRLSTRMPMKKEMLRQWG